MKPIKLAMLAAAACGLVSQTAFADTVPAQSVPALHRAQPVKVTRLAEKRHAYASADGTGTLVLAGLGGVAVGAGICLAASCNSGNSGSSTGS